MDDISLGSRLAKALSLFSDLMLPYVQGEIEPETYQIDFEHRYLRESPWYDEDVFQILDRYFSDVDEFVADPRLREHGELGPDELMTSTRTLLERAGLL